MNIHHRYCRTVLTCLIGVTLLIHCNEAAGDSAQGSAYAGSDSCRECHDKFHTLWSTSRHRDTIRPYTPEFGNKELLPQKEPITIGNFSYGGD